MIRNVASLPPSGPAHPIAGARRRRAAFMLLAAVILAAGSPLLWALVRHAWSNEIQQHIVLIPFVSLFLWWDMARGRPPAPLFPPSARWAACFAIIAFAAGTAAWFLRRAAAISHNDALTLATFSLLALLLSAALATLGWRVLRPHQFAICFLALAIPLPDFVVHGASIGLQYASADAAEVLLRLSGTSFSRDAFEFHLPALSVAVAEECSGSRSTFVLFITSLLAGHLLLRRRRNQVVLVAAVLPLAVLRNGFRIASITWLSAHVDMRILDSALHHRGGPIFFALSLVPFFFLLRSLRRAEQRVLPQAVPVKAP